jgi:hypothetical protein
MIHNLSLNIWEKVYENILKIFFIKAHLVIHLKIYYLKHLFKSPKVSFDSLTCFSYLPILLKYHSYQAHL